MFKYNIKLNFFYNIVVSPSFIFSILIILLSDVSFTAAANSEESVIKPQNHLKADQTQTPKYTESGGTKTPKIISSASELDYPPFAIVRADGTADGFSVELLKAVTKAVGLEVNITVGPWHELKERLKNREIDVLPLVAYSKEREKIYDFSAPYLRMSSIAVFVRKGESSIHGYAELKNREVLVMRGDTAHEYAVKTGISDKLIVKDTFEEAMLLLSKGEHDAVIIQQLVGLQLIKKLGISNVVNVKAFEETNLKPNIKKLPYPQISQSNQITSDSQIAFNKANQEFEQKFCFAVQEGDHLLLGLLNEGLAIVFANGTYNELYNKWFAPILPQPPIPITLILKYLLFIVVPLMLVLAIAGIWFLKREVARKTESLMDAMKSQQQTDTQYRTLFNKMVDGFALHEIICDQYGKPMDFRFLSVNPSFERMSGLSSSEITGKTIREIRPNIESYWIDTYGHVALTGEGTTFEYYSRRMKRHLNVTVYQPQPMQFASIFEDITERKLAKEKEERLKTQLEQAQRMESIGTLAGGIAHDFNNILSPIIGYTEILIDDARNIVIDNDNSDKPANINYFNDIKCLDEIYKAALRAKELVKQILTFSRQSGTAIQIIKIQPIIKEVLKLIRSTIPTTIEIRQDIKSECGHVKADPTQIHQIVMNLVTNAFHAMEDRGGELTINLKEVELGPYDSDSVAYLLDAYRNMPDGDIASSAGDYACLIPGTYACLAIEDTGVGIDSSLIPKIFDPFFTTKGAGKGTGLGLSVVHGIVKGMNGTINVYSEPGKGTKFNIYLPVVKTSSEDNSFETQKEIIKGTGRVLLVDDEKSVAEMEKKMLERIGYEVVSSVSSIEALEVFRTNPNKFDLVITDMTMPVMEGDKLAAEMIKIRPDIPILLCTGFSHKISQEKVDAIGIKGILMKPVIMKDLAEKIRTVLNAG
ncbi:MAG: transporter substrate-binding domain-containing protein [Desulfamplus sp.]|nr:transporter substrate-binding domain-containing protein [Desulfamplus sp.]